MALMIHDGETPAHPSDLHENVFNILQTSPHTRDWVVFYRKGVPAPPWRFDEPVPDPFKIDFIVYIPECLVICLGVENDLENAMEALEGQYPALLGGPLLLGRLAVTDQDIPDDDPLTLPAERLVNRLKQSALGMFNHIDEDEDAFERTQEDAQTMWNELRNELEGIGPNRPQTIFRSDLETLRPQLLRLTEEQGEILNILNEETRYVIDGAAGTGKTVLAQELAKRRCKAGDTVALLCSNPNLIRHLEPWAKKFSDGNEGEIVAGTPATLPSWAFSDDPTSLARHQQRLADSPELEKSLKFGDLVDYLDNEWSSFVDETVKDLGQGGIFDYLVVDEAQNLCDEIFLELMNALLKKGLTEGCFTMFGDFTNQNIVSHQRIKDGREALKKFIKSCDLPSITLRNNCRNTHQIAQKVAELTDIKSPPISGVHGPDVQIEYFISEEGLGKLLNDLVSDLKERQFRSRQIILLSSDDGGFDAAGSYGGWKLSNIREAKEKTLSDGEEVVIANDPLPSNVLRYSDVYDFQGLESEVAILVIPVTDEQTAIGGGVILPYEDHLRKMLYTGMSRAKAMLIIVADKKYKQTLERRQKIGDPPSHH